jgi:hypothetical protein
VASPISLVKHLYTGLYSSIWGGTTSRLKGLWDL